MRQLSTASELEAIVGTPIPAVRMKQIAALDDGCRRVLAQSPIAGCGFRDDQGVPHSTFVGGQRGFMRVDSPTRIAFELPPQSPEPLVGGGISFVFLLPGVGETLRLNGTLAERAGNSVAITVEEAFVHCARCILRSALWQTRRSTARSAAQHASDGPLGVANVAAFLAASPFAVISTWDAAGKSDTSPRGDEPGFLRILDGRTLVIPDRRGNRRTDTFHNLLQCDRIAIAAVVPGRDDVMHIRGTAHATADRELLSTMALPGKVPQVPQLALLVNVEDASVMTNDALRSAQLWRASAHVDRAAVPDMMGLASQHLGQNEDRGVQATLLRVLGRAIGAFPGPLRRLIDWSYRKNLADEGYGASNAVRSGLGARAVRVAEVIRETAEAVTLVLEDPSGAPFFFEPGQYFTLLVEIDGEQVRRAYSASSLPGSPRLSLTVKRVAGGRCSSFVNEKIRPGDRLALLGPSGSFCVRGTFGRELVLLAGGSGITPLMSIARSVLAGDSASRVVLVYGNRGVADIIFADALNALRADHGQRFVLRHVLERPPAGWRGGIGLLDEATLRSEITALSPSESAQFFVCGPEPMLRGVRSALVGLGIASERIHEERFSPPRSAHPTRRAVRTLPMIVEQRGRRIAAIDVHAGKTLLEVGLEQGLPLPFSCAMGNCGECRVKLARGDVEMDEPNTLSAEARKQGCILTCVARPLSAVSIDIDPIEDPSS